MKNSELIIDPMLIDGEEGDEMEEDVEVDEFGDDPADTTLGNVVDNEWE